MHVLLPRRDHGSVTCYRSITLSNVFFICVFSDNPTYRRASDGIILGPDLKRGSLYYESYPTSAPPRPPMSKRSSMNGHVNPALTLREEIVTMNPLYEGQVIEHKDLDAFNCSDFGVHPDQIVLEDRKNPYGKHATKRDFHLTPVSIYSPPQVNK